MIYLLKIQKIKITPSGDNWLQENMGINIKTDVPDIERDDLFVKNPKNKNEYYLNQRYYKQYPSQDLYGLKISQDILESIYNNKTLLIRAMKQIDRHGDGLIPKYDFINTFHKLNCHHALKIEMIEKIVNLYINNDPNIIMIQYVNLINNLCKDLKEIIDNEYKLFPIDKYKYSISVDNKREISANKFSRDTGNLSPLAISSIGRFKKLPKIRENEISNDLNKISKVINYFTIRQKNVISYMELMSMLEGYNINISKEKIINILKYLDIKNPNSFYLNDFITKVNSSKMCSTSCKFYKPENTISNSINIHKKNLLTECHKNNCLSPQNSYLKTNSNFENCKTSIDCSSSKSTKLIYNKNNTDTNILSNIKNIKIIKDKIFEKSSRIDNISEYFDHLLSYNICRRENVIFLDELERLFILEKYNFSLSEIKSIFDFIDIKKDGFIDRIEFIQSMKNVPHPLSIMINYMKNKNLKINDIAYKMNYDLYSIPLDSILNEKLDKLSFQIKIKAINEQFDKEFIYGLFNSISDGANFVSVAKIFNKLNYNNDESYKHLSEIKDDVIDTCINVIQKNASFTQLKDSFVYYDQAIKGKIPFNNFMLVMKKFVGSKLNEQYLVHLLRINKYIDSKNNVDYRSFLLLIYIDCKDDTWLKCLNVFKKFLHKECNDDMFIFIVKINNFCNNITIKKTVDLDRFLRFFSGKINCPIEMSVIKKFDYNKDGLISMDDLKNIVIKYIDVHYFDNKKQISDEKILNDLKLKFDQNKKLFIIIKEILNENDMTQDNLFYYLDINKDGFTDFNEFKIRMNTLLTNSNKQTLSEDQMLSFFNYLDEYSKGKVDINMFRNKLRILNDDIIKHHENGYKGNSIIENLILTEFSKWFKKNMNLSDTELFPILDHDHDGKISINDIKYFAKNIILMPANELSDDKILHFIESISLNNQNNLVLADIQVLMQNIKNERVKDYLNNIHNYCNEGICEENKDKNWINDIIYKIGMFINEHYENDIEKFYNDYNVTNFRNEGKGLSFDNFVNFLDCNHQLLESYCIKQTQQMILFKHISSNNKFITLDMLKKLFGHKKEYDFYSKMHKDIIKFLHENFPTGEDAFKFFHNVKTINQETPTYNDNISINTYITKKEFFYGINRIFPSKFNTDTVLNYYRKYFKKNLDENSKIKFCEFNYVYYGKINFDKAFTTSLNSDSKILTTRPSINGKAFMTFNSPFAVKKHEKFETPYNLDPLEKIKRLILSSKINFKKDFKEIIDKSGNGMQNQFEFRNTIKKLDLGLTNIEIEDIIHKSGLSFDGQINLVDFYKYITEENKNLVISKKHVLEQIKEIKQLIYKYYTNPRLAFELNDLGMKGKIDFDKFKKIIYDVYARENKQVPSYPVMKYVYDYIDVRKDGVIDLNEWNKVFAKAEGKLDITEVKQSQMNILREWETSNDIIEIYKLISKNRKLIKDKVKLFNLNSGTMLIKAENLVDILKSILNKIRLSQTQWKMIVSIGDVDKSGIIDFNTFLSVIETTSKMATSHPV